jgi:DNA-directed RNA polymerase subunit RPC12/RpoP
MNDSQNWGEQLGNAFADLIKTSFWAMIVYWFVCGITAGVIADYRNRNGIGFFFATLFFLGPLGIAVAMLAPRGELDRLPSAPKRKIAEGRQRFTCPRCGADNDLSNADTSYDCWRCGEHRNVKPKATTDKKT